MASRNELIIRGNMVGLVAANYPNDSKFEQKILYLEKNGTTFTGTLATQVLTSDASAQSDGDKIIIGGTTYTFKTNLTGVKATSTLTNATSFTAGETVTIDGKQYTFVVTPVKANDVAIGANVAASLDNIKQAINQGDSVYPTAASNEGIGTNYGLDTARHSTVSATTNGATTQVIEARDFGTVANAFTTVETCATGAWTSTVMAGGVANVVNEVALGANPAAMLVSLKKAINGSATEGTDYSYGTRAHTQVSATTITATQLTVQALDYNVTNASIGTTDPTDTGSHMSWGATTLASGVLKQTAIDAAASAGVSGDKNVG